MFMDQSYLLYAIYVSVFMLVMFLAHSIWQLCQARNSRVAALRRRLRVTAPDQAVASGSGNLRRERPGAARETDAGIIFLRRIAGLIVLVGLGVAALTILFDFPAWQSWLLSALTLAGGFGGTTAYLRYRKGRRLARFGAQLPDALEVMVRSLRAGHPIATAMSMVASDLPQPIAGEFSKAVNEMTYGLDLRQALSNLAERIDAQDLRFVVATVRLQHETGGNLAEVLQRLADLMRVRARLTRKVYTFTAEARLSARILAVMPLIFVAMIFWANPEIYSGAARDPLFLPVLLAAGGLQIIGILVMSRMARIRV